MHENICMHVSRLLFNKPRLMLTFLSPYRGEEVIELRVFSTLIVSFLLWKKSSSIRNISLL
jgi:hypothetical protein